MILFPLPVHVHLWNIIISNTFTLCYLYLYAIYVFLLSYRFLTQKSIDLVYKKVSKKNIRAVYMYERNEGGKTIKFKQNRNNNKLKREGNIWRIFFFFLLSESRSWLEFYKIIFKTLLVIHSKNVVFYPVNFIWNNQLKVFEFFIS